MQIQSLIFVLMEQNLRFAGHETFACKQFWLKKGYDFALKNDSFGAPEAVSYLGVGKNMVAAINYWTKSFDILDDNLKSTELGDFLFGENAKDKYLEDIASLWLLHYSLISKERASIYYLLFNEFIRERIEFTKEQLHVFLKRKCYEISENVYNEGTINRDITILLRNYVKPKRGYEKIEIEDDFSTLLLDLELLTTKRVGKNDFYTIEIKERENIPIEVILFVILNMVNEFTITFQKLMYDINSPGRVFCLNQEGLYNKIVQITEKYEGLTFTRTAGNEVLQINNKLNKWEVISEYYK